MPIGEYRVRVEFLWKHGSKDGAYGQAVPSYIKGGIGWAHIEQTDAGKRQGFEQVDIQTRATIRVRGYPILSAKDRLRVKATGEIYQIVGVREGVRELIVDAFLVPGVAT